jgi:hypothetical protein
MVCPVTPPASGEARKSTTFATSSGRPMRPKPEGLARGRRGSPRGKWPGLTTHDAGSGGDVHRNRGSTRAALDCSTPPPQAGCRDAVPQGPSWVYLGAVLAAPHPGVMEGHREVDVLPHRAMQGEVVAHGAARRGGLRDAVEARRLQLAVAVAVALSGGLGQRRKAKARAVVAVIARINCLVIVSLLPCRFGW